MRIFLAGVMAVALGWPLPAHAQEQPPVTVRAGTVELVPTQGTSVVVNGRRYGGPVRITSHPGGLVVVETVSLNDYLGGIQEVPFSWEPEALRAQAIAARTYLAWTLQRGRNDQARALDFDICATDACQVYAGLEPGLAEGGDDWLAAVESTGASILIYDGEPALTYYSSTSGGRTRTVTDVWPDRDLPYLKAVESPNEDSPFARWDWWLGESQMSRLLSAAGMAAGELVDVRTETTEDGGGPWRVVVTSERGEESATTWDMRSALNAAAARTASNLLPALRPDGRPYPQTILSPTFTVERRSIAVGGLPSPRAVTLYEVQGRGWGHQVGMSQYGAQAMASAGAGAAEILAHYYGGLTPVEAPQFVPETIEVALETAAPVVEVGLDEGVEVMVDGRTLANTEPGSWTLAAEGTSVALAAPVEVDLPPRLRLGRIGFDNGRLVVRPELNVAADVSWSLVVDGVELASFGPERVEPGYLTIPVPWGADEVQLTLRAVNDHGETSVRVGFDGQLEPSPG